MSGPFARAPCLYRSPRRRRVKTEVRLFSLALLAVLAAPGLAHASTASVSFFPDEGSFFSYTAAPGETNNVEASHDEVAGVITIRDTGATITPVAPGCTAVDPNEVTCAVGFNESRRVALGDLNDTFQIGVDDGCWEVAGGTGDDTVVDSPGCGILEGGPGDDTLQGRLIIGGAGNDTLTGSSKRDFLGGGAGDDTLSGFAGRDSLAPGPGDDTVDGGASVDELDFASAKSAVTADLATGLATGEGADIFVNIENLTGSVFDDRLIGDSEANSLKGFRGDDVLIGRAGADKLNGSGGRDRLYGGRGHDSLLGGAGDDYLRGGPGKDFLTGGNGADRLAAKDGFSDRVAGGPETDRARVDGALDVLIDVEKLYF